MSERRRLRAAGAERPDDGRMPGALERFRVADWIDHHEPLPADVNGKDGEEVFTWRAVWARRRWRDARDVWELDHGQYRGRWLVEERRWEQLGWAEMEQRHPEEAARLRAAARRLSEP